MKLLSLYKLSEAGVSNSPTKDPRKKRHPQMAGDVTFPDGKDADDFDFPGDFGPNNGWEDGEGEDDDGDDLGPDVDYDDPTPDERDDDDSHKPRAAKPFKEPEKVTPMFGKSAKPSPALQGGKSAGNVKADAKTLGALQKSLESVRTGDEDLQDWIDDVIREIGRAVKSGTDLTLPKFEATPNLDDFDDDGGSEDEDY